MSNNPIKIVDAVVISTRHRAPAANTAVLLLSTKLFFWCRFPSLFSFKIMFSLPKFIASNSRVFWGWLFLILGSVSFMGFLYAAVISKIQPPSHNAIIRAIQNDWYYCFLVPLTAPILFVAVYFHWLSMKLFKHA